MADPLLTSVLLGVYVGVIPVYLGLFPAPLVRRMPERWLDVLVALTVGVLAFLLIDVGAEAFEMAQKLVAGLQVAAPAQAAVPPIDRAIFDIVGLEVAEYLGPILVVIGLTVGLLALVLIGRRTASAKGEPATRAERSVRLAMLVAAGIGLHNLGEGLAVGAAVGGGNVALAGLLIAGFAIHNTTEGLAILGPLGEQRVGLRRLAVMGALAGVPTIAGALIGLLFFSNALAVLFFALAAGAILYVILEIVASLGSSLSNQPRVYAGFLAGFVLMYVTGLFVAI
jgi:zinc transporter ZupT